MLRARLLLGVCTTAATGSALLAPEKFLKSRDCDSHHPKIGRFNEFRGRSTRAILEAILIEHERRETLKHSECHMNTFAANSPIEDSYAVLDEVGPQKDISLFAVFDGHSGFGCSEFCRDHFFDYVVDDWTRTGKYVLTTGQFLAADIKCLNLAWQQKDSSGACANVMQLHGKEVTVANAGDCRAVLGRKLSNGKWEAVALSKDHEISSNEGEKQRLLREHPDEFDIIFHDRIKGHLQPTRGMGDGVYKQPKFLELRPRYVQQHGANWHPPYSTAEPDIVTKTLGPEQQFIVMASDGLFMDLDNQQVVDVVANYINNPSGDKNAATMLIEAALVTASERAFGGGASWLSRMITGTKAGEQLSQLFASPVQRRRHIHDDITALVVFINQDAKAKL